MTALYRIPIRDSQHAALGSAGFRDVEIRDRNAWYLSLAERELAAMATEWQPLLRQRLGPERAQHFVANWQQLVLVLPRGELRPAHLRAYKAVWSHVRTSRPAEGAQEILR